MMFTEQQVEAAIKKLRAMIEAAENANQHGEDAVIAAAAGLNSLAALRLAKADIGIHCNDGAPETVEALARVCDAIACAEGRAYRDLPLPSKAVAPHA